MNINELTGRNYFDARNKIGLSIVSVAKITGINRNTLSKFEQEKATISAQDKKQLATCYEERGYDFSTPESTDTEAVKTVYAESKAGVKEAANAIMTGNISSEALGTSIAKFADCVDNLVIAQSLSESEVEEQTEEETLSLPDEHYALHEELLKHFDADKAGETKGKVGLFGEDGDERAAKLTALLARQYLQVLSAESPETITLNRDELTEKDCDNLRLLNHLDECLAYDVDILADYQQPNA